MAQDATKIVKRANDDIDSDSLDEFQQNNNKSNENENANEIGDPWEEMKEENELNSKKEREEKRKERQNELLGIDTEKLNFDDETGLVVPIKNLVNFAGRGRDIKERRQSAFGFAHFSTEESSQAQIAEFQNDYGIDALLSLLESDDNICRRYSALALGNIVSNNKFSMKCIEFGVLEAMLPLAINDETDLETRRYCMLAVANMAAEKITHSTIMKSLEHIIILVDSFDEEIQKCATLCLQNLSANRNMVLKLQDAIQPLVNLISICKGKHVPLPDSKLHSVAALRGLCIADVLRLKIINEGVLRAFLQIIDKPPNNAILVEISAILCGFSSLYETHIDLLQPAVLHSIFLLAMGDIVEAQQFGATTLANLSSNSSNHDKLIEANAICNLLIMCDYNDDKVKSSSTRALANFATNTNRHKNLLDQGCLQTMIKILNSSDPYNNMFSALFFSILCDNQQLHEILSIPEIIQPLFHLIVMSESAIIETIRYSVLSLANLATTPQSHPFILSEIEIQLNSFFNLSNHSDIETQRYFGLLLSNLAENVNSHDLLSTPIALKKILVLLQSLEIEVVLNSLSFILKVLSTKKDSIRIRIANIFTDTIQHLPKKWKDIENEELSFMVSAYFSNITKSSQVRKQLKLDDKHIVFLLGSFIDFSKNIHQDIRIHAINGLANLRDVNDAVNIMVKSYVLKYILKCIQSPNIDIHSSGLRLMSGISSHQMAINQLKQLDFIHLIGPFVRSPHSAFRKYAYICLANYASHQQGKINLNDINLIKCYLNVSIDEKADIEEMRCCLFALANTAYHKENRSIISESGIIIMKTLLDYVKCNDTIINEYASLLLANCSIHLSTHSMYGYHDIIQMILVLAASNESNPTTTLNSIKCLRNLSFYDEHIDILLECKITDFIIKFIKNRKHKSYHQYSPFIDKQLAGLVYNLSSHPPSIKYIARNDLISSVTSLLVSNQSETRRDAARALTSISRHTDIATPLFLESEESLEYILSALKFKDDLDLYHSLAIIFGYIFSLKQIQTGKSFKITRTHILSLLRKPNRQIQLAALWATSTGSESVIMKDEEMLQFIAGLAEPQLPTNKEDDADEEEEEEKDNDNDQNDKEDKARFGESPLLLKIIRRRALITLVNYAKNEENHRLIITNCANVISNAFNMNDCNDMDVILLSAMLLSNLTNSLNEEIHEKMIGNHDVSSLDLYLGHDNENIQMFAVRTLTAISNTEKFAKALIISEKIIPLLCLTTLRGNLLLNQEIASFFQNLTRHEKLIPMILEQHLIPTLIELLKTNIDITIRIRVIKALQNCCCCHETLTRMIEVENGVPFLWNLLCKFAKEAKACTKNKNNNKKDELEFICAVIKILALFTQIKDCKSQFQYGLYHNLNYDDTLSKLISTKKNEKSSSENIVSDDDGNQQKSLDTLRKEFQSDRNTQNLCKMRLAALLGVAYCVEDGDKILIARILQELTSITELHPLWMTENLVRPKRKGDNKQGVEFYQEFSLTYLTLYSLFSMIGNKTNKFLTESALISISQLCIHPYTAAKLLELDRIQGKFDVVGELQQVTVNKWLSIRTTSMNILAFLMEQIQNLIIKNNDNKELRDDCFKFLKRYYHEPSSAPINGFNAIKLNAKIPDIRLQAQSSRLLSIFSSVRDYVDYLNNDEMYALLFLLAEQAWRIGGDTEIKSKDNDNDDQQENPEKIDENKGKDDALMMAQAKDARIIHSSVVTCLSNMTITLKNEFIAEETTLMAAILRYVKDRNPEIRSLAFICISGAGKRGIAPLFHIWEDPVSILSQLLESVKSHKSNSTTANTHSNIMKAFALLSENPNHLTHILNENDNNNSIFKLLIQYAQSLDSYVRYFALTAINNIISLSEWQKMQKEGDNDYNQPLIKMLRYLLQTNKIKENMVSHQNYITQNRNNREQNIEELLLSITANIAKIPLYQQQLLTGDKPTVVHSLINEIILNPSTSAHHSYLSVLSLYNLSLNEECFQLLIDEKAIEAALYITLNNLKSVKHCFVALSCIAHLSVSKHERVIKGREIYLQSQHEQIVNQQKELNSSNTLPLFALETLNQITYSLNNHQSDQETTNTQQDEYSISSVHGVISLIACRMSAHPEFELNNMDLCYINTIIYYLSSRDFLTQTHALITFLNFLCKSSETVFHKIVTSRSWITTLLCFIPSTNLDVRNIVLKCILLIIDDQDINQRRNKNIDENVNTMNKNLNENDAATLRTRLENKPRLLRILDELFCDSHFLEVIDLAFSQNDKFTLTSISRIFLILCENMPITTLLIHREPRMTSKSTPQIHGKNQLLSALIEFVLNPDPTIKLNGAAALSCFLSHSYNDSTVPRKILSSADNGIDIDSNNNRGLMAFYEMITNKDISTFSNNNRYLNAKNAESAKPIGATVISALAALSSNTQFAKQFVNTGNGLAIITNEILNGIAIPKNELIAFDAAQILRNVCKDQENIKSFLNESGCQCLLSFISSKSIQLKFLAAGALADIVYHATANTEYDANNQKKQEDANIDSNLFAFTTEHLSPYMTTITDCLLQLLTCDTSMDINSNNSPKLKLNIDVNIPSVKSAKNNNKTDGDKSKYNTHKLVRICLALLHRLCKDSDNCKKLIVESGAIKPLCVKWFESIKKKYPETDIILSLLKCLATFHETQIQFIQQNGDSILSSLVNNNHLNDLNKESQSKLNHNHAAVIISSLCKNKATHELIATHKVYSLLLTLRHSPDNEARKLAMDTLLTFLENKKIHHYVCDDVDLGQTLAAIAKFGASKQIKQRSGKIIKVMLGQEAYLEMTQNHHPSLNKIKSPKFAKAKTMKSPIKSPNKKDKKKQEGKKVVKVDVEQSKNVEVNDKDNDQEEEKVDVISNKNDESEKDEPEYDVPKDIEINNVEIDKNELNNDEVDKENKKIIESKEIDESEKMIDENVQKKTKPVDFWHDEDETDEPKEAQENATTQSDI